MRPLVLAPGLATFWKISFLAVIMPYPRRQVGVTPPHVRQGCACSRPGCCSCDMQGTALFPGTETLGPGALVCARKEPVPTCVGGSSWALDREPNGPQANARGSAVTGGYTFLRTFPASTVCSKSACLRALSTQGHGEARA